MVHANFKLILLPLVAYTIILFMGCGDDDNSDGDTELTAAESFCEKAESCPLALQVTFDECVELAQETLNKTSQECSYCFTQMECGNIKYIGTHEFCFICPSCCEEYSSCGKVGSLADCACTAYGEGTMCTQECLIEGWAECLAPCELSEIGTMVECNGAWCLSGEWIDWPTGAEGEYRAVQECLEKTEGPMWSGCEC